MKYLPLFHHFKAIYQFPKHIICLVKIVANASLKIMASISLLSQVDVKSIPITENESVQAHGRLLFTGTLLRNMVNGQSYVQLRQVVQRTVTRRHINKNNI